MRILLLTQFFLPEIGATQTRLGTFAEELTARGHVVDVICAVPNHPQGVIRPEFRGSVVQRREIANFSATYVWVHTRQEKTTVTRLSYYASYAGLATLVGAIHPRPDVILASSPPLPVAAAGAAVAARHRVPWVMDVRDLWPAAAVAMGELGEGRALGWAQWLERRLYRSASEITVVTEPFREKVATVVEANKISLIPNGTTEFWLDASDLPQERRALGLPEDEFIWTFAGNVGAAQGLESAIEAAALLGPGFRLLVLGDGPARSPLERLAMQHPTAAVEFRHQVPPPEARRYLRSSDALFVSLAADPIFEDFVPSKLFDFCATGRPVICAAAGEPARLLEESAAGVVVSPGDARSISAAVDDLAGDGERATRLGGRGRAFASSNLRSHHVQELEAVLIRAASATRAMQG